MNNECTKQSWVNVKTELPENDGKYLCYFGKVGNGVVREAEFNSTAVTQGKFPFGQWVTKWDMASRNYVPDVWEEWDVITYWMSLPEPPTLSKT